MTSKLTHAQAFPVQAYSYDSEGSVLQYQSDGLTIRQHIIITLAAAARSNPAFAGICSRDLAEAAAEDADALIAELEKSHD